MGADCCRGFPASTTIKTTYTSTAIQARAVLAHASCTSDDNFMDAMEKEVERNPSDTFVVSLAADATQETLTLNLIPFIGSSIARSTWKVLVSLQRFSWSFQEVPHLVVLRYEPPERAKGG